VELHAAIPMSGGLEDVTQVKIQFTYSGTVMINSVGNSPYPAWSMMDSVTGNTHTVTFSVVNPPSGPGSAPINNNFSPGFGDPFNQSFAGLSVSGDTESFANQNSAANSVMYTPTGFGTVRSVPEPGSLALLGSLGVGGGLFLLQRRRK
jgi:hypothetical protein